MDKSLPMALGAKCDECPLRDEPYVLGHGPDRASLIIVGEAPGRDEVRGGVPFTGRSGQLMDRVLQYHGIERDGVWVTNTCLCRPPSNATPSSKAINCCAPRLIGEIRHRLRDDPDASAEEVPATHSAVTGGLNTYGKVQQSVKELQRDNSGSGVGQSVHEDVPASLSGTILALGAVASKVILGTGEGITRLRQGGPKASPYFEGVKVIPTYHPAAALRNPDFFPSIVGDVKKLQQTKVIWEPTKYKVAEDPHEAAAYVQKQLEATKELALDIEVNILDMNKWDPKNPDWRCIGISHRPGAAMVYGEKAVRSGVFQAMLRKGLHDKDKTWIYQNGKFDIQALWEFAPEAQVGEDTMLMHYACDERKGTHGLETLATEYLGAPSYKVGAKEDAGLGKAIGSWPTDILYRYNATDVDVTFRLLEPLREEMQSDGTTRAYEELLIPGSNALAHAEYSGVRVDTEYAEGLIGEYQERCDLKETEAQVVLGHFLEKGRPARINIRSPQQVMAAFRVLGMPLADTRKETLRDLVANEKVSDGVREFAKSLLAYRTDHKLFTTYVKGLAKHTLRGRIHPTFLLHGTETGRLSCRRPNLQNIPTGEIIRDAFTCGPNSILLSADYSQIEFVLLAILSGDEWLLSQFREGRKFHHEVAVSLFGENYTALQYLRAKAVNFGLNYGRSAWSLWQEHGGTIDDWERMVREYFARMPRVREYQLGLEQQIKEQGYLESYFGRRRRFWLVLRDNWHFVQKEGYNFPLQSTASDLTLLSLIRLEPLLRGKAVPVITVHDSLVFEVRRDCLEEVTHTVKTVMEDTPLSHICPTPVEMKIGTRWGFAKSKKNQEWYELDVNGRRT